MAEVCTGRLPTPGAETPRRALVSLVVENLAKSYGRRGVFRGVSFELTPGQSLIVTGRNGSGKSTLIRILCGLVRPSAGTVTYRVDGREATGRERRALIGLVAPDLVLYEELSALENLQFFARVRGVSAGVDALEALLSEVGLEGRGADRVGTFSSGMRQRLKYAYALLHRPPILFLDEPTANLDEAGVAMVRACVSRQRASGILVVATNDHEELQFGDRVLRLGG